MFARHPVCVVQGSYYSVRGSMQQTLQESGGQMSVSDKLMCNDRDAGKLFPRKSSCCDFVSTGEACLPGHNSLPVDWRFSRRCKQDGRLCMQHEQRNCVLKTVESLVRSLFPQRRGSGNCCSKLSGMQGPDFRYDAVVKLGPRWAKASVQTDTSVAQTSCV
jgi:hypothetical protein